MDLDNETFNTNTPNDCSLDFNSDVNSSHNLNCSINSSLNLNCDVNSSHDFNFDNFFADLDNHFSNEYQNAVEVNSQPNSTAVFQTESDLRLNTLILNNDNVQLLADCEEKLAHNMKDLIIARLELDKIKEQNEIKETENSSFKFRIEVLEVSRQDKRQDRYCNSSDLILIIIQSQCNKMKSIRTLKRYNVGYRSQIAEKDDLLGKMVEHIKHIWSTLIKVCGKLGNAGLLTEKQQAMVQKRYNEEYLPLKNSQIKGGKKLETILNSLPALTSRLCKISSNKSREIDADIFFSDQNIISIDSPPPSVSSNDEVSIKINNFVDSNENNHSVTNQIKTTKNQMNLNCNSTFDSLNSKLDINISNNRSDSFRVKKLPINEIQNESLTKSNQQNQCNHTKPNVEDTLDVINITKITDLLPNVSMPVLELSSDSDEELITVPELDMLESNALPNSILVEPVLQETITNEKEIEACKNKYVSDSNLELEKLNDRSFTRNKLSTEKEIIHFDEGPMNCQNVYLQGDLSDNGDEYLEVEMQNSDSDKGKKILGSNSFHDSVEISRTSYFETDNKNKDSTSNFCLVTSLPSNKGKINDNCCIGDAFKNSIDKKARKRQKNTFSIIQRDAHSNLTPDKMNSVKKINHFNENDSKINDVSKSEKSDINKLQNSLISEVSICNDSCELLLESKEEKNCVTESLCSKDNIEFQNMSPLSENHDSDINELIFVPEKAVLNSIDKNPESFELIQKNHNLEKKEQKKQKDMFNIFHNVQDFSTVKTICNKGNVKTDSDEESKIFNWITQIGNMQYEYSSPISPICSPEKREAYKNHETLNENTKQSFPTKKMDIVNLFSELLHTEIKLPYIHKNVANIYSETPSKNYSSSKQKSDDESLNINSDLEKCRNFRDYKVISKDKVLNSQISDYLTNIKDSKMFEGVKEDDNLLDKNILQSNFTRNQDVLKNQESFIIRDTSISNEIESAMCKKQIFLKENFSTEIKECSVLLSRNDIPNYYSNQYKLNRKHCFLQIVPERISKSIVFEKDSALCSRFILPSSNNSNITENINQNSCMIPKSQGFKSKLKVCHEDLSKDPGEPFINSHDLEISLFPTGKRKRTESSPQEEILVVEKSKKKPCEFNFVTKSLSKKSTILLPGPSVSTNWKKSIINGSSFRNLQKRVHSEKKLSNSYTLKLPKISTSAEKVPAKRKIAACEASYSAPIRIKGRTAQSKILKKSICHQLDESNKANENLNDECGKVMPTIHDDIENYHTLRPAKVRKEHKKKDLETVTLVNNKRKSDAPIYSEEIVSFLPISISKSVTKSSVSTSIEETPSIIHDLNKNTKCADNQLILKTEIKNKNACEKSSKTILSAEKTVSLLPVIPDISKWNTKRKPKSILNLKSSVIQDLNKVTKSTDNQLIIKESIEEIKSNKAVEKSAVSSQSPSCIIFNDQCFSLNSHREDEKSHEIPVSSSNERRKIPNSKSENLAQTNNIRGILNGVEDVQVGDLTKRKPKSILNLKSSVMQDLNKITKCTDNQLIIKEDVKEIKRNKAVEKSAVSSQSPSSSIFNDQCFSQNSHRGDEKSHEIPVSLSNERRKIPNSKSENLAHTNNIRGFLNGVEDVQVGDLTKHKPESILNLKFSVIQDLNKVTKCADNQLIIKKGVEEIKSNKAVEKSAVSSQYPSCIISNDQCFSLNTQRGDEKSHEIPVSSSNERINIPNSKSENLAHKNNIRGILNGVEDVQVGDLNFKNFVHSLTEFLINPANSPDISTLIFLVINYLTTRVKDPLFNFIEGQESKVFLRNDENCIVASLFEIEKKKTYLQDLIRVVLSNIYQIILVKKSMKLYRLASLCRVFTEICKRIGDRFKPLSLCCDVLKKNPHHAPCFVASIAGVWKELFAIADDYTDEDIILLGSIAYGALKKPIKQIDYCWEYCSTLLLEYFTIPSIPDTKKTIELIKNDILSQCTKKSFGKSWQLTSSLLIIAVHEPLDFFEKNLIDEYILPNLLKFSNQDSHEEAFNLFCNFYVDVSLLHPIKLHKVFIEFVFEGNGIIQDCAAAAYIRYLLLRGRHIPDFLTRWLVKNLDNPRVKALEKFRVHKKRSNPGSITIKEIIID
ncbi:uncharacterized protein CDAR_621201 [Caerostris darwini]|uniref:Uncharacterized protein n=1 Tax=Caerostris darwini TaxID=1538125 RepID=A0AAV4RPH2_9ARAC|nr:uncharacterized protein CDAR_621201 [Caerostris darwini]